jgi:hypothetical protein
MNAISLQRPSCAPASVCFSKDERSAVHTVSGIEGVGTRTKAIVPIFVAGEFMGVVGFDNTRQHRAIEASELPAALRAEAHWASTTPLSATTPPTACQTLSVSRNST